MGVDKSLKCVDCGADFLFTTGEQEFYASQGFTSEPRRCPNCRAARKKDTKPQQPSVSRSDSSSVASSSSRPSSRQMFSAVCAECGKETQVPFQPSNGRPIYCSDCFHKTNGNNARPAKSFASGNSQRSNQSQRSNSPTKSSPKPAISSFEMDDFLADMCPPPNPGRNRKRDRRDRDRGKYRDTNDDYDW
ncbi:zinc-ribbon domain containing protein [bacterium]|nr:zinc-ribbon domain containing protein [bacterium]